MTNKVAITTKRKLVSSGLAIFILFGVLMSMPIGGYAGGGEALIPSFGDGNTKVRIYTDYFCPPCRAMEPRIEPIISELIRDKTINLTFIDTPFYRHSALYARYFLYAINESTDLEHVLNARKILVDAASKKVGNADELEEIFKINNVAIKPFDAQPTFNTFSGYLKNDEINATPTCVIELNGKKQSYTGADRIIEALNDLKRKKGK